MQTRYPKTWAYLKRFEKELRQRSGFQRYFTRKQGGQVVETGPFYSIFNVGEYTFAPWKVVWGRIGNHLEAAVASQSIPQETISFVACHNETEAHYIAALVNSIPFQFAAHSYSQAGGKSFGSPHILENVCVPRFNAQHAIHSHQAALSQEAHRIAPVASDSDTKARLAAIEAEIDSLAAQLWSLTDAELAEIRAGLKELKGITDAP
jgi:hypothetical protein